MSYSNMNSKYRSVEDTVVTKNILAELDLPEISNKLRVISGTLDLSKLPATIAGQNAGSAFLDSKGHPLSLPRGAYIEKVILRYDGSTPNPGSESPITGTSDFKLSTQNLVNGSLGTSISTLSLTNIASGDAAPITDVKLNGGTTYIADHMVPYADSDRVLTGYLNTNTAMAGVVRANVYLSLM